MAPGAFYNHTNLGPCTTPHPELGFYMSMEQNSPYLSPNAPLLPYGWANTSIQPIKCVDATL